MSDTEYYEELADTLLVDGADNGMVIEAVDDLLDVWEDRDDDALTKREVEEAERRLARANDTAKNFGSLKTPAFQFHHVLTVSNHALEAARDLNGTYPFLNVHPETAAYMALLHDIGRILSNANSQRLHEFTGISYLLGKGLTDIVDCGQIHFVTPQMLGLLQDRRDQEFDSRFEGFELPPEYQRNPMHYIVTAADASCANARIGVVKRIEDILKRYGEVCPLGRALKERGGEAYLHDAVHRVAALRSGCLSEEEVGKLYDPLIFD